MADQTFKQSLVNELAIARSQLGVNKAELRNDLAVGRKFRNQLHRNPVPWFAGAAVFGLLLSKLPPMRRKVVVKPPKVRSAAPEQMGKAGIAVAILNFVLQLAKPTLLKLIRDRISYPFSARNQKTAHHTQPRQHAPA